MNLIAAWAPLLDSLPMAGWIVELAGQTIVAANPETGRLLELRSAELVGRRVTQWLATPEDQAYWSEIATGHYAPLRSDSLLCTPGGGTLHVERHVQPLPGGAAGVPTHALVTLRDRSAEQRAEDEREAVVAELQATLESTGDGILVTDLEGRVRAFNRRFGQIWAVPEGLLEARDSAGIHDWMRRRSLDAEAYERRLASLRAAPLLSSSERLELVEGQTVQRVTRPLWGRSGPQGRVYSFSDLTELVKVRALSETLSSHDALTRLPNRALLAEKVSDAAQRWRREQQPFALLVVDLDHFRRVNDSFGQRVANRVLCEVGERIGAALRSQDVLARIGGDSFAVLLQDADRASAQKAVLRVLNAVNTQPFDAEGTPFSLSCSIGIALCPQDGQALDDLVRQAEAAVRNAKAAGRAGYRFAAPVPGGDAHSHVRMVHAMREALRDGHFRLHYQPQIRLRDGAVCGAEALLRWRDPQLGEIAPAAFIPVAEDSGFIVTLGNWVLSQAVRQAALWHEAGRSLTVAINVSALQFRQPDFVSQVADVLAVSGLPAHLLELELTESILVDKADEALERLQALDRLGLQLALDDFGTGYSCLGSLKRVPVGRLKIDRSFVAGLPDDETDVGLVRAITQLAQALGKRVVAEGVENEAQRRFIAELGCESFQGFLYAPAMDAVAFERHLPPPRPRPMPTAGGRHIRLVR
ncbi:putative bifunctional diguanylate cyclase/phosphodiesterase [Rubrivivax gelatinosus]|uniref:Diguanylate cyclase (GGDEF)-like protein n=1 Tax=Rubrivivax gelatinosus TaxID=28068 RepID=A0A4R2ME88_RUBGE|nr:bifunctional diguanylate cyclase/phosphodiesterase [Rubrivivax gelatinosus]MBK1686502.1 diguanylate cyclase [Rubrivivax gelatinosus]TCP00966.1 diguanylate cyclase (GGDEF)-like protein [Rubrivivax gelatinosus]